MDNDKHVGLFAILLYIVISLYIYGMYRMSEMNNSMLRGSSHDEL